MVVLVIVPTEKRFEPASSMEFACKVSGIIGLVFQGLELRFAKRVVVRHVGAAEATLRPEGGEQLRQRVALHRRAAIRVNGEARFDAVSGDGLSEELGSQVLALA